MVECKVLESRVIQVRHSQLKYSWSIGLSSMTFYTLGIGLFIKTIAQYCSFYFRYGLAEWQACNYDTTSSLSLRQLTQQLLKTIRRSSTSVRGVMSWLSSTCKTNSFTCAKQKKALVDCTAQISENLVLRGRDVAMHSMHPCGHSNLLMLTYKRLHFTAPIYSQELKPLVFTAALHEPQTKKQIISDCHIFAWLQIQFTWASKYVFYNTANTTGHMAM